MKEAEQTTEVFQMGEITSWIHTIKEVFSEAEQKKYDPALVHLINRNKTKKDSANFKKAELQILELRARLRMREQKPPRPQSNSDKKNEVPFSWTWKLYNFEINKDIFVFGTTELFRYSGLYLSQTANLIKKYTIINIIHMKLFYFDTDRNHYNTCSKQKG